MPKTESTRDDEFDPNSAPISTDVGNGVASRRGSLSPLSLFPIVIFSYLVILFRFSDTTLEQDEMS